MITLMLILFAWVSPCERPVTDIVRWRNPGQVYTLVRYHAVCDHWQGWAYYYHPRLCTADVVKCDRWDWDTNADGKVDLLDFALTQNRATTCICGDRGQ